MVALVRCCRAFGNVIVTSDGQDAAPSRGARHVGMFENIRAAVYSGPLAIPNAKNAIQFLAAWWRKPQLLGTPQCCGRELFVDAWLKNDVMFFKVRLGFPQSLVITTQRRATVAADQSASSFASQGIALLLQHRQANQGLNAAHEGST